MGNALTPASDWQALPINHQFDQHSLTETLLGGQAFRWFIHPDQATWTGIVEDNVIELRLTRRNQLLFRSPTRTPPEYAANYLATQNLHALVDRLPWRSDPVLADLRQRWARLTILHQPIGETVLAFLLSSNKQIVQIREMLETLARTHGSPIAGTAFHRLPTWPKLALLSEADLRECRLGYRAKFIHQTALFFAENPLFLASIESLYYDHAHEKLQILPGVGAKVADCILLFAYQRLNAFPVDTWIERILESRYNLTGWSRPQLAQFARLHFGQAAGLAQQWFFADARSARSQQLIEAATWKDDSGKWRASAGEC